MDLGGIFSNIGNYFTNINWANPGWDVFILLFFVLAVLVYGFSLGRDRIIIILVSLYVSLAILHYVPDSLLEGTTVYLSDNYIIQISSFIALFMVLFFLLSRVGLLKTLGATERFGKLWHIFVFSFLHIGLFIAITLSFLPSEVTGQLSPMVHMIFLDQWALFSWLVAPVLVMTLIKREDEDRK